MTLFILGSFTIIALLFKLCIAVAACIFTICSALLYAFFYSIFALFASLIWGSSMIISEHKWNKKREHKKQLELCMPLNDKYLTAEDKQIMRKQEIRQQIDRQIDEQQKQEYLELLDELNNNKHMPKERKQHIKLRIEKLTKLNSDIRNSEKYR